MGTLFWVGPQVLARDRDWSKEQITKVDQSRETSFHAWRCHHGLPRVGGSPEQTVWSRVAPRSASEDYVWVECFYTMDKRKKVVREIKGLPQCTLTSFPRTLGEYQAWNQVIVRLHAPRTISCHHCHRVLDHRLSVSDFLSHILLLLMTLTLRNFFSGFRLA